MEILDHVLQYRVFLRYGRHHTLKRNWDGFSLISFLCFRHFASYTQPLTQIRNFSPLGLPSVNCPARQLRVTRNCGVPTIQLLAAQEKQPHHSFSQQCFFLQKMAVEKEETLKYPPSLFFPLSLFTLTEMIYQMFFPNRYNYVVTAVVIRISKFWTIGFIRCNRYLVRTQRSGPSLDGPPSLFFRIVRISGLTFVP